MSHFWIHVIQNSFIFINFIIIIYLIVKFLKCKYCKRSIEILDKNVDLLTSIHRKQHSNDLKKMIELYTEVQSILKISEASFISLFRYDYSKTYVMLNFMFSINKNGEIIHESYLDKLPATSNMLNIKILESNGDGLHSMTTNSIKELDMKAYELIKFRGIEKLYYKNIKKESPLGYLAFCYPTEYNLEDDQAEEILQIMNKISELL